MVVLCPKCWSELRATPATCPSCGSKVDLYSRDYERRMVGAVAHASAERRAQICWLLGMRGKRSAVPALVQLLADPDTLVRVAALRALGEIGDDSAVPDIEKVMAGGNPAIRTVARQVLELLGVSLSASRREVA
jgi:HEAT repeat protein